VLSRTISSLKKPDLTFSELIIYKQFSTTPKELITPSLKRPSPLSILASAPPAEEGEGRKFSALNAVEVVD
jgi:hypothetical protein